jgi:hypothetical protein
MARYVVEEENRADGPAAPHASTGEQPSPPVGLEGLAVAKALARKRVRQASVAVIVRDTETGEVLARYEPVAPGDADGPSLANSVRRMRAANDRLKEALVPPGRSKRG